MRYIGGKDKLASKIAEIILPAVNGKRVIEPFCGGLSVSAKLQPAFAADINGDIIALFNAVQNGWEPPTQVSEDEYHAAKRGETSRAYRGFVGHTCSWGAKWFGGYARGGKRNFALEGARNLKGKMALLTQTTFVHRSYVDTPVNQGDIIYCDPPYHGTTTGYGAPKFQHDEFWSWVRDTSKRATIFISEYSAPSDVEMVAGFSSQTGLRNSDNVHIRTTDNLYRVG